MALIQYILFRLFAAFMRVLPYGTVLAVGKFLGRLGFLLFRKRREIAVDNIMKAFPEMSAEEARALAKKSFEHLGLVAVEILSIRRLSARKYFNEITKAVHIRVIKHKRVKTYINVQKCTLTGVTRIEKNVPP